MPKYKVLAERDKFVGKFDPAKLEKILNDFGSQGWRLAGMATADVAALTGKKQEMVFVLEHD
jgi:hypothetical protein